MTSPNYPENYDNNLKCSWNIIAPAGMTIVMEQVAFNLEQPDSGCFDRVEVSKRSLFLTWEFGQAARCTSDVRVIGNMLTPLPPSKLFILYLKNTQNYQFG